MLIRSKLFALVAPLATFGCVLAVLMALNAGSAPPPPAPAPIDVSAPPDASTAAQLRSLERAARDAPARARPYAALGDAYLQRWRETADPAYFATAERAFRAALRRNARDVAALVGAGTLANLRHDFRGALQLGLDAHAAAPALARPYTVIADAELELGRYKRASAATQRLVDLKPGLASYARASYVRELYGDLPGAAEAMRLAVSAGGAPESRAYVETLLGDIESMRGRAGSASAAYRGALADARSYAPALVGLARVEAAGGGRAALQRAAARLRRVAARLPRPSTLTLLAETELAAGRRAQATRDLDLVRAQHRLLRAAGAAPDAELVLFEATHGDVRAAVRLGRRVWSAAPSVRSADALAWALTRAGRPRAGLRWARRALRLGSRDPSFRLHAGLAAKAAGRPAEAARELELALGGAPALSPLAAREAERALRALR